MIISRLSGGLGNQLFQYFTGKAVAKYHDTNLKFDTSFFRMQSKRILELTKLKTSLIEASPAEIGKLRGRPELVLKLFERLTAFNLRPKSYVKEIEPTVLDTRLFEPGKNKYIEGYWQTENYFKDLRIEVASEASLREPLTEPAKKLLDLFSRYNFASVHVRRGDYISDPRAASYHGTCDQSYFLDAIQLLNQLCPNDIRLAVFSDDIRWCQSHLPLPLSTVFVTNTRGPVEELYLMSQASHNIISNSSFSWWGAWLNNNPDKIIIAPERWLLSNPKGYKWTPSEWRTI